jgi:hypothetical protein
VKHNVSEAWVNFWKENYSNWKLNKVLEEFASWVLVDDEAVGACFFPLTEDGVSS